MNDTELTKSIQDSNSLKTVFSSDVEQTLYIVGQYSDGHEILHISDDEDSFILRQDGVVIENESNKYNGISNGCNAFVSIMTEEQLQSMKTSEYADNYYEHDKWFDEVIALENFIGEIQAGVITDNEKLITDFSTEEIKKQIVEREGTLNIEVFINLPKDAKFTKFKMDDLLNW